MKPIRFMKRTLCLLLVLASFALPAALATSGSYYVNVSTVNVRSGPSSGYSAKKKLHKGDVVTYQKAENGWWKVRYSGGSGWIELLSTAMSCCNGRPKTDFFRV